MGSFGDWFTPSDVAYPGLPGTTGGNSRGNVPPPERQSFFNRFFAPSELPYPVYPTSGPIVPPPTPAVPQTSATPTPAGPPPTTSTSTPTPTTSAPSSPTPSTPGSGSAQAASPVTVIVQACPPAANAGTGGDSGSGSTSGSGSSTTPTRSDASVSGSMPLGGCPAAPAESIVVAYSTNPRLRARHPRAQEVLVEELLGDENFTLRMLSRDGAPLTFVVPDGCNAVDFTFGAIELNPGHGHDGDLDEVVTVGAINAGDVANGIPLTPGDEITVVVPWRHGSWVELAAGHLRVPIVARFYQIESA